MTVGLARLLEPQDDGDRTMKLSRHIQQMMLIALPLVIIGGAPAVRAADDEMAPRHWVESRQHSAAPVGYSYRRVREGYGWRAAVSQVGPAVNSWNGCGVYRYWNGEQCVDARDVPPKY